MPLWGRGTQAKKRKIQQAFLKPEPDTDSGLRCFLEHTLNALEKRYTHPTKTPRRDMSHMTRKNERERNTFLYNRILFTKVSIRERQRSIEGGLHIWRPRNCGNFSTPYPLYLYSEVIYTVMLTQNRLLCLLFHNTSPPEMRTSYKQAPEQRSRSKLGVLKNRTINLFPVKHQMRRSHWRRQEGNRNQKKSRTMEPQIKTPIDPLLLILICFCGDAAAAACYTESVDTL